MLEFFLILLVGLVGGALPLVLRWSDRQFHSALALSTGIFLGAVFLHLLPVVAAEAANGAVAHAQEAAGEEGAGEDEHDHDHDHGADEHAGHSHGEGDSHAEEDTPAEVDPHAGHDHAEDGAHAGHVHGDITLWLFVLLGVLGVYLIEAFILPGGTHGHGHGRNDAARHRTVGIAALLGLSVHALTAGVALAAAVENEVVAGVMLLAILAHKGFESFSLASVFGMSTTKKGRIFLLVVLFSLVTPLGLVLGGQVTHLLGQRGIAILTALAAGTFLYVCLCELLPEVFHHREDVPLKIVLLLGGVAVMWVVHEKGGI